MANAKISQLPAAGAITGAELVPVVQSGTTSQTTVDDILTGTTLTSVSLVTSALGTPASGNLANCTFPTLNQNTTGSAGSVDNAVTFDTSGGDAAGATFDGSGVVTVDYSTVGAPKADGTDASGSWGIDVTGNSATTDGTNVIDCTASLPAATLGLIATLDNVSAATGAWGETVAFGGGDTYLCFANGANWTIIGA